MPPAPIRLSETPLHITLVVVALTMLQLLACGGSAAMVSQGAITGDTPGWACPSPTPLSYGAAGPVKEVIREPGPTAAPTGPVTYHEVEVFYEEWEQEYPEAGGPPFPSPTPYVVLGTTFSLGQRVRIPPLFVQIGARSEAVQPDGRQLYRLFVTWLNPTQDPIVIDYGSQLQITSITSANGGVLASAWSADSEALRLAGGELPTSIPTGSSQVTVPFLAPAGEVRTVALSMLRDPSFRPRYAVTQDPAAPTQTPTSAIEQERPTATPNTELRARPEERVTVQFVSASPAGPRCDDTGAITPWETEHHEGDADVPVPAPPGAARVVQVALNQVGRRYIWGAKGPYAFDCSGLVSWSYGQIGLSVPNGTANQWPKMRSVSAGDLQPGDLVFFAIGGGAIDHVAILTGDLDGDGAWDMVHAASPSLGVRVDYNVFGSSYYAPRIRGYRTAR